MNFAHVLFVKEQYQEAIKLYEQCVKRSEERLLDLTAIVIANFCVSLIMTSLNEIAEEWMRKLEAEEERISYQEPDKPIYHLCIVNLVIGTLYCAKGNFKFGLSRIIKSLEPYDKKVTISFNLIMILAWDWYLVLRKAMLPPSVWKHGKIDVGTARWEHQWAASFLWYCWRVWKGYQDCKILFLSVDYDRRWDL